MRREAGIDEVVPERVHEMEKTRGAMRVPPLGGERVEVGDFVWVDRGMPSLGG